MTSTCPAGQTSSWSGAGTGPVRVADEDTPDDDTETVSADDLFSEETEAFEEGDVLDDLPRPAVSVEVDREAAEIIVTGEYDPSVDADGMMFGIQGDAGRDSARSDCSDTPEGECQARFDLINFPPGAQIEIGAALQRDGQRGPVQIISTRLFDEGQEAVIYVEAEETRVPERVVDQEEMHVQVLMDTNADTVTFEFGGDTFELYDDGTHGDEEVGDGVYTNGNVDVPQREGMEPWTIVASWDEMGMEQEAEVHGGYTEVVFTLPAPELSLDLQEDTIQVDATFNADTAVDRMVVEVSIDKTDDTTTHEDTVACPENGRCTAELPANLADGDEVTVSAALERDDISGPTSVVSTPYLSEEDLYVRLFTESPDWTIPTDITDRPQTAQVVDITAHLETNADMVLFQAGDMDPVTLRDTGTFIDGEADDNVYGNTIDTARIKELSGEQPIRLIVEKDDERHVVWTDRMTITKILPTPLLSGEIEDDELTVTARYQGERRADRMHTVARTGEGDDATRQDQEVDCDASSDTCTATFDVDVSDGDPIHITAAWIIGTQRSPAGEHRFIYENEELVQQLEIKVYQSTEMTEQARNQGSTWKPARVMEQYMEHAYSDLLSRAGLQDRYTLNVEVVQDPIDIETSTGSTGSPDDTRFLPEQPDDPDQPDQPDREQMPDTGQLLEEWDGEVTGRADRAVHSNLLIMPDMIPTPFKVQGRAESYGTGSGEDDVAGKHIGEVFDCGPPERTDASIIMAGEALLEADPGVEDRIFMVDWYPDESRPMYKVVEENLGHVVASAGVHETGHNMCFLHQMADLVDASSLGGEPPIDGRDSFQQLTYSLMMGGHFSSVRDQRCGRELPQFTGQSVLDETHEGDEVHIDPRFSDCTVQFFQEHHESLMN